jgi:hypothetical protein
MILALSWIRGGFLSKPVSVAFREGIIIRGLVAYASNWQKE